MGGEHIEGMGVGEEGACDLRGLRRSLFRAFGRTFCAVGEGGWIVG